MEVWGAVRLGKGEGGGKGRDEGGGEVEVRVRRRVRGGEREGAREGPRGKTLVLRAPAAPYELEDGLPTYLELQGQRGRKDAAREQGHSTCRIGHSMSTNHWQHKSNRCFQMSHLSSHFSTHVKCVHTQVLPQGQPVLRPEVP